MTKHNIIMSNKNNYKFRIVAMSLGVHLSSVSNLLLITTHILLNDGAACDKELK